MEDMRSLVEGGGHSPKALEGVDRSLYFTTVLVHRAVEACGPVTRAASALAVGTLVAAFGNGVFDLLASQVAPIAAWTVRLEPVRPIM
ncbi:hypothetical protein GCM10011579_034620 [Streptomyces albiflavescens]|uniref:Uncharacterized protein n=1 Tax=Streptomyces albiflavescens TaxID=1623582 RepID=A0A917Y2E6_9ACTN|nr:hypothetical protein GCM10011579_034620 [Streptomyces albiflavescens]